jgi:hypothetical protein
MKKIFFSLLFLIVFLSTAHTKPFSPSIDSKIIDNQLPDMLIVIVLGSDGSAGAAISNDHANCITVEIYIQFGDDIIPLASLDNCGG